MTKGPDGKYPYKNIFHTITKTIQREGFTHLWVGFPTFYTRIAPHVLLTWMFMGFFENTVFKTNKK